MQREKITELVEAEQTEIGVMAAEVAADESAKKTVGESDERHDQRNVDTFDKSEHT